MSLRSGSTTSKERATIEYRLKINDGKIIAERKQTLGRFNKPLNESWMAPIEELDNQVERAINKFNVEDYTFTRTTKEIVENIKIDTTLNKFEMVFLNRNNNEGFNNNITELFLENDF